MQRFEYKVVPAPRRGQKGKGVKGAEARFANALETVMNDMAAQGWDYLRTDTLPSEERSGITSRQTIYQNMLVFCRPAAGASSDLDETPANDAGQDVADKDEADNSAQTDAPATPDPEPTKPV